VIYLRSQSICDPDIPDETCDATALQCVAVCCSVLQCVLTGYQETCVRNLFAIQTFIHDL